MNTNRTPPAPGLWARTRRWLRHAASDPTDARKAVGPDALKRLHEAVSQSERHHLGEIRLCIEAGLPRADLARRTTPRQRALAVFGELGVWNTEHNNGVLIYLLVADRAIEIVADRGLHRHVPAEHWHTLVAGMSAAFAQGRFEEGLLQAVNEVDSLLRERFPRTDGDVNPNELPDAPVLR